jgi:hypothetical protein
MKFNRYILIIFAAFFCAFAQIPIQLPQPDPFPPNRFYSPESSPPSTFDSCDIRVFFKDGTFLQRKDFRLSMETSPKYNGQCLKIDTMKILPAQTDSVKLYALAGIPRKNVWVWRIIEGNVCLYSSTPSDDQQSFVCLSKGTIMEPFSRVSLKKALEDNPEASGLERSYTWGVNSTIVMALASVGFMMASFANQDDNQTTKLTLLSCSGALGLSAFIVRKATKKNREKAVYIYNHNYYQ